MSRPFQRARHVDRREAGTAEADIRALEQELVLALSSLLPPHGKAPSQETARQNAHRLVLELVRRAGVGDPQRLEARLRRVCTLHEVFGGSSWLSATQINALQAAPPSKKSDPAQAWERDGRIFGVRIDGKKYFPAY